MVRGVDIPIWSVASSGEVTILRNEKPRIGFSRLHVDFAA